MTGRSGILANVRSAPRFDRPRRTIVYGPEGAGKTTFVAGRPGVLLLAAEAGSEDTHANRLDVSDLRTLFAALTELAKSKDHGFQAVALDSITAVERLVQARVAESAKKKTVAEIEYGKGYQEAAAGILRVLQAFDACAANGMEVLIVAHAAIQDFRDPASEPYKRYSPLVDSRVADPLKQWADEVLFLRLDVLVESQDVGFGKREGRGVGIVSRRLICQPMPWCVAKHRVPGLPGDVELPDGSSSWAAYEKVRKAALHAAADKEVDCA